MNFESHLNHSAAAEERLPNGLTSADIAALSHYPSLDKLFHDANLSALQTMKNRLETTLNTLERVILRGSKEDAQQAKIAADSVKTAVEWLTTFERMHSDEKTT